MSWDRLLPLDRPNPEPVFGDPALARAALADLLGPDTFPDAVEAYVTAADGAELARSLLQLLRPPGALDACHAIFADTDREMDQRRAAVELMRVVADDRALDWFEDLIATDDPAILRWTASLLDTLVREDRVDPEAAEPWICRLEVSPERPVHELMAWLREELDRRRRPTPPSLPF